MTPWDLATVVGLFWVWAIARMHLKSLKHEHEAAIRDAVAEEREACAKVADEYLLGDDANGAPVFAAGVATAIRSRANEKEKTDDAI